mmetsp:Transcript_777/g.1086  ORF Transcript_777/g.1086 Transcript_777/m.1086 type:complete len:86 (+) Transcript_777:300-557(+)
MRPTLFKDNPLKNVSTMETDDGWADAIRISSSAGPTTVRGNTIDACGDVGIHLWDGENNHDVMHNVVSGCDTAIKVCLGTIHREE